MRGSSVVSPRPHTKRGRTTIVSKPLPCALQHHALRQRLGGRVGRRRVEGERLASRPRRDSGWPCSIAASVPTCTSRRTPARRQASTTDRVPSTLTRRNSLHGPQSSTLAAAWKAPRHPRRPPRAPPGPRGRRAPARRRGPRTAAAAASLRASARTSQPSAHEPLDQAAADEAGAAGDEGGGHGAATLVPRDGGRPSPWARRLAPRRRAGCGAPRAWALDRSRAP